MSSIPSSAMPHASANTSEANTQGTAGATGTNETGGSSETNESGGTRAAISKRAGQIKDKVRENPKTSIGIGAAVVAGAVAAAAIPLVKGAKSKSSTGAKKKTATKQTS